MTDKTPIASFLSEYAKKSAVRLHMPGHKGVGNAAEQIDLTEIVGADSLFEASGIIAESEKNAGSIFGAETFYSTEGSSLSIRAMLYLAMLYAKRMGRRAVIAAGRNAHKAFLSAAALVDIEVDFIYSDDAGYLSCKFTGEAIAEYLEKAKELPTAVYITSPDYLGSISDIRAISEECRKRGVLLIVDNAHGAYLKFLTPSMHPIDLGADMCCDSAHKTLSALTGCAYLHVSHSAPAIFKEKARSAMMLFASTSPSYLMLDSLDRLNASLSSGYKERLSVFIKKIEALKARLIEGGYSFVGDEPMKLTLEAKKYGYYGTEISDYLLGRGIYTEFSDPDYLVLMPSPENSDEDLERLFDALSALPRQEREFKSVPKAHASKKCTSIRDAVMADSERLPISECLGRVASTVTLACPPAIPIVMPGEMIDEKTVAAFNYYGVTECEVIK